MTLQSASMNPVRPRVDGYGDQVSIVYGAHVVAARAAGAPVVALETTIVSHGLPRPDNLRVAREIEATVRAHGAVPATIGMVGGQLVVGVDDEQLNRLATSDKVAKLSARDLAVAAAAGAGGAATVAGTPGVAPAARIGVFAPGGGRGGAPRPALPRGPPPGPPRPAPARPRC